MIETQTKVDLVRFSVSLGNQVPHRGGAVRCESSAAVPTLKSERLRNVASQGTLWNI